MRIDKLAIEENLDQLSETNFLSFAAGFASYFEKFSSPEDLCQALLESVAGGAHSRNSTYAHDNGYLKLTLAESRVTKSKVRLNLWNIDSFENNIHNHRWDFCSHVLFGSLTNEIFERSADGQRYNHYRYTPLHQTEDYHLAPEGSETLGRRHFIQMPPGTFYYLSNDVLHRSRTLSGHAAVTLMITRPDKHIPSTDVYSDIPLSTGNIPARRLPDTDVINFLQDFSKNF